ncbi:hypothetical protein Tco_0700069, partial [Tanacetum coccineum]
LEAGMSVKSGEVYTLTKQNAKLLGKVSAFDSERGELNMHIIKLGVDCERPRHEVAGKVISMAINKGIQQGLEVGVVHGGAGRSLSQIEAYDPDTEGKYVVAVSKLENVSFPLLDELEILKDSPLALIMYALALKDDDGICADLFRVWLHRAWDVIVRCDPDYLLVC